MTNCNRVDQLAIQSRLGFIVRGGGLLKRKKLKQSVKQRVAAGMDSMMKQMCTLNIKAWEPFQVIILFNSIIKIMELNMSIICPL